MARRPELDAALGWLGVRAGVRRVTGGGLDNPRAWWVSLFGRRALPLRRGGAPVTWLVFAPGPAAGREL
jgi:hypothetical protein